MGRLKTHNVSKRGLLMETGEEARRMPAGIGAARAYELVRKELFSEFGADFYRSYVDPLRLVADLDGVLLFRASTQVAKERLRQQAQRWLTPASKRPVRAPPRPPFSRNRSPSTRSARGHPTSAPSRSRG
jgi:hypothetical protein